MRSTLHLASSADYPIFAAAIVDARRAKVERRFPVDLDVVADRLRLATKEPPRTWGEWRELMISLAGRPPKPGEIWPLWTVAFMHARLVHLPPSGTYSFYRSAHFIPFEDWVGAASVVPAEPMRRLLGRYLAAFGPGDDRRHGVVDGSAYAGLTSRARRRSAHFPRRGGPAAVRRRPRATPLGGHAGTGAPASQVGLLTARLCAARARANPPRALPQAGDCAERRRRADDSRRRLRRRHVEGREEAPPGRALHAASEEQSATSSRPKASDCSRSSRERARAHAAGVEPGVARPPAAPQTVEAVHPPRTRADGRHPEPVRAERVHPALVVPRGLPPRAVDARSRAPDGRPGDADADDHPPRLRTGVLAVRGRPAAGCSRMAAAGRQGDPS